MIPFKAGSKTFNYPNHPRDVNLSQFIKEMEILKDKPKKLIALESAEDEERKEILESITNIEYAEEFIPYMLDYVCIYSDLDRDTAKQIKLDDIETLYTQIRLGLSVFQYAKNYKYSPIIEFNKTNWYLPTQYMQKSTVIEFMQAAQFEKHFEKLTGAHWAALPELMAILLRAKKDEKYDPENVALYNQRKHLFRGMPLDKALSVGFFLLKLSERYAIDSLLYTLASQTPSLQGQA